jgi:hypothetical protein
MFDFFASSWSESNDGYRTRARVRYEPTLFRSPWVALIAAAKIDKSATGR